MIRRRLLPLSFLLLFFCEATLAGQELRKVPTGVILVPGALPSASDTKTPLPEDGRVSRDVYRNTYFDLTYPLPEGWVEKFQGPPPSESGAYVLAQIKSGPAFKGDHRGSLLISAQDLFFTLTPAAGASELIENVQSSLPADFKVERPLAQVRIADHPFTRLDYTSPVAQLHWYVLATEIRCHAVRFVYTSREPALLESLIEGMNRMKLDAESMAPACVAHYAEGANVTYRVEPVMTEKRYNNVPVRVIIDKTGKIRHVHVISGYPDQAKSITDALMRWRLKPYLRDGQPVEVETGILFGGSGRQSNPGARAARVGGD